MLIARDKEKLFRNNHLYIYSDLKSNGVFAKLLQMINDADDNLNIIYMSDSEIMSMYNVRNRTVQMFKAFIFTGYKKILIEWREQWDQHLAVLIEKSHQFIGVSDED